MIQNLIRASGENHDCEVVAYGEEGAGKIATFWLAKAESKAQVSGKHDVAQGTGAHYYAAYSSASQTDVTLAVQNNTDVAKSYQISGVWDEETN